LLILGRFGLLMAQEAHEGPLGIYEQIFVSLYVYSWLVFTYSKPNDAYTT
jgi:hypothetical protein